MGEGMGGGFKPIPVVWIFFSMLMSHCSLISKLKLTSTPFVVGRLNS